MRHRLLVLFLLGALPVLAASYTPLQSGVTWTYEGVPPLESTRLHALGSLTAWNGLYGHTQVEIADGAALPTTHWSLDDAGRLLLLGIDWGSIEAGGRWYFDPAPVYLDDALAPGESLTTSAGVYEAIGHVDQWYGLRPVTVHCLAREAVDTPYGTVPAIAVEVTWDQDPDGAPWTYARRQHRTYGEGLGLIAIASLDDPDLVYALSEVNGLEVTDADTPVARLSLTAAPTPFNPTTTFRFALAEPGRIELAVYDLAGRHVETLARGSYGAGLYAVGWQPHDLASGVYLARLVTDVGVRMTRVTLLE
jgi:hypothetical protein